MHLVFIHETLAKQNNEISFGLSCSSQLFIAMDDELTSKKPSEQKQLSFSYLWKCDFPNSP